MADRTDLEARRLALEEERERNARDLRARELEIEAQKLAAAHAGQGSDRKGRSRVALISVLSAAVGAAATVGAAFLTGVFDVEERRIERRAVADLEQQKFSYELISAALSEQDDRARAQRLRFMVEIGLLDNLDQEKLIEYAELEVRRIESGDKSPSLLPYTEQGLDRQQVSILPGHAVRLVSSGLEKIAVIKEVRAITGWGLARSKEVAETPGALLVSGLGEATAAGIADRLRRAGATVEIEKVEVTR